MKCENKYSIVPLKMIRIVKGLKVSEMAIYFECSQALISSIENETRSMYPKTLIKGLKKLGITFEDYEELVDFRNSLYDIQKNDEDKYKYMLIKTIGILLPNEKDKLNEFLDTTLCKNSKKI